MLAAAEDAQNIYLMSANCVRSVMTRKGAFGTKTIPQSNEHSSLRDNHNSKFKAAILPDFFPNQLLNDYGQLYCFVIWGKPQRLDEMGLRGLGVAAYPN